jgi:hypothetical protein
MKGFSDRWRDFPDYILGITREIWEDRGIATLHQYYAPDIVVRTPIGRGAGTRASSPPPWPRCRVSRPQLLGEDVIWSGAGRRAACRRTASVDRHASPATAPMAGPPARSWSTASSPIATRSGRDRRRMADPRQGAIVRQLGHDPRASPATRSRAKAGRGLRPPPLHPRATCPAPTPARGNDNEWGARYADVLTRIMAPIFCRAGRL